MTDDKPKVRSFEVSIELCETYSVEEIWTDGNAPADPTLEDVIAELERDFERFGVRETLCDYWGLAPTRSDVVVADLDRRRRVRLRERKG